MNESLLLVLFNAFVLAMLAIDLGLGQRRHHFPSMKEAITWTCVWISIAILFGAFIWHEMGSAKALEYYTGYIVEESLSVDNVFVFILIFNYFAVPKNVQHKVLFWGVLSAIVFRAIFIVLGAALVAKFHWILYLLGAFLVVTAVKLAIQDDLEIEPEKNPFIRLVRKMFPMSPGYVHAKFFTRENGRRLATPLLLVLVMIETTDIAFATDSIPAIFAITRDTTIIYTSNILAVLGLRALYFVVAGFMKQFRFLKYGLSVVLAFIGIKMLVERWIPVSIQSSLLVIFSIIATSILSSLLYDKQRKRTDASSHEH